MTANNEAYVLDSSVKIVKSNGNFGSTNKADVSNKWPESDTYKSYGSSSDLWDEGWTPADINNSNFGVALSASITGTGGGPDFPCLDKDTLIYSLSGLKPIKDLKIGDKIFSYNIPLQKIEEDEVTQVAHTPIVYAGNKIFIIHLEGGGIIKATADHLFYVLGEWVHAEDLREGQVLLNSKLENLAIQKIEIEENYLDEVWDITVKKNHNYFANNVLVHNVLDVAYVDHFRITVYYTN